MSKDKPKPKKQKVERIPEPKAIPEPDPENPVLKKNRRRRDAAAKVRAGSNVQRFDRADTSARQTLG